MAKFSHLSRSRLNRYRPARCPPPSPEAAQPDPNSVSGVPGGAHPSPSDLSDAAYLISRVQGACESKAAYTTRREVRSFLSQTGYRGSEYLCQFCHLWHVTTMEKREQKVLTRQIRSAIKLLDSIASPL